MRDAAGAGKAHVPLRLQLYNFVDQGWFSKAYKEREAAGRVGAGPSVFHSYRLNHRSRYRSSLYVTITGTPSVDTKKVRGRPQLPTEIESHPDTLAHSRAKCTLLLCVSWDGFHGLDYLLKYVMKCWVDRVSRLAELLIDDDDEDGAGGGGAGGVGGVAEELVHFPPYS